MREQKYADVLKKYEEEHSDELKEEKLSMTREIKFSELQKKIDALDIEEEIDNNIDDDLEDGEVTEEFDIEEKVEEKEDLVNTQEKKDNDKEEDIYLTTSFKPFKKRFRISKVFKIIIIILLVSAILFSLGFFVIKPLYNKYLQSKPHAIFNKTIDVVSSSLVSFINDVVVEDDKYYLDLNYKLNSNIEDLYYLTDFNYGFRIGIDPSKKVYDELIYIRDNDFDYGLNYIEKDDNIYVKYSTSDRILNLGKIEEDNNEYYNEIASLLDESVVGKKNLIYYIEENTKIFKELLDVTDIVRENDELSINSRNIKVVRNTLNIDFTLALDLAKRYKELVLEDDKLLDISASFNDMTIQEYKDYLDNLVEEIDKDYQGSINIYTINGNEFVGIDIEENGFRNFYYYNYLDNFEFYFNATEDEDCLNGGDCVIDNQNILSLVGEKKDNYINVDVIYNNEKIAVLEVKDFSKEKIDFAYEIIEEDSKINGNVLIYYDSEDKTYNIDFGYKKDNSYINMNLYINLFGEEPIGVLNNDNIVLYTESVYKEENNAFGKKLDEVGLREPYIVWNEFFGILVSELNMYDTEEEVPIQSA